ncbi:bifunctional demethylmenaquinone methyltransferase/2-methoxy-6-polyprenyl-1,4-benzoquinol methylase UbiE [Nitrosococcus oceani]|uniref:Ubiquinone/menaquinone biosynthesis C-methyltransferase UbiE n=2 Tax=Nitrosococcus oceani TaxID=1229 RepID=Q3J8P5_NITOC|nr:bifunctional demethylmenaquinone methyltransferase/2-methoxy-6-polyprenyl-1,4-benzoquinol methylase UbiE [Nitrosococcus oceani]KFI18609.1 ubiquinone biosynthesis methyltransferase UbiE [Nitrosococcus oceani C-27]ABA58801.1 demethylmenaquinone methyltransferase / 2-octaprenyl-6-methoxy-1,4-benzoquinone methylase [Nitrosococcus oceani ATCC 19707]EDZ66763.1 ubiquinone/menaquinone biosynthesis methyltransferases subfamily [Nitrosococcus oceani AFC27]KFI21994.1 ubiquinone biosynthesis methyltrans
MAQGKTTHFGFQEVPIEEKSHKVAEVFHSVASHYDLMNDLMSLGIHRLWKRFVIELSGVRSGMRVLDLAGGTGDLAKTFSERVGNKGQVVLADINSSMLEKGRERLVNLGKVGNLNYVQANAEHLPFPADYFDRITIAFGLRNITQKEAALHSMYQALKPGGQLLVLEFSKPASWLTSAYDIYSFWILPRLGKLVAGDADSYRYLAESIRRHPDQETLSAMMRSAGFDYCDFYNLNHGIVALHRGYKY